MEYLNYLESVIFYTLVSWWVCSLEPLKALLDPLERRSVLFYNFISPILTCYWCSALWFNLAGLYFEVAVSKYVLISLFVSFVVRVSVKTYENGKLNG